VIDDARGEAARDVKARRRVLKAYAGYLKSLQSAVLEEESL